jgi:hypothetical protein
MTTAPIRYIARKDLDVQKWDDCIAKSANGLIYATSVYLDAMSNWDALVMNDYHAVMPLTYGRKYWFYYLYQPAFIQQLGVFSQDAAEAAVCNMFLQAIPDKFRFWDIQLNHGNSVTGYFAPDRINYLLPLERDYESLRAGYSRSANRNIQKASEYDLSVSTDIHPSQVIGIHKQRFQEQIRISDDDYRRFEQLVLTLQSGGRANVYGVYMANELVASSIYLQFKDRLTFILNGNSFKGLQIGASHFLKDFVIRSFAGHRLTMDFEGSDFRSFARFYEQFGSKTVETYPALRVNRLPFPFSLFKR